MRLRKYCVTLNLALYWPPRMRHFFTKWGAFRFARKHRSPVYFWRNGRWENIA